MTLTFAKLVKNAHHFLAVALIFVFPFFFLPITANFFETNKLMLLIVVGGLLFLSWGVSIIVSKKINLVTTPLTLPILLIGVSVLVSTFLGSQNPTETLFGLGLFIPALVILSLTLTNTINNPKFLNHAALAIVASSTLLSILSIFQSLGFGLSTVLNRVLNTTIPDTLAFTPAGSPLALIVFLVAGVITTLFMAFSAKEALEKIALFLTSAVVASGLVLLAAYSLPGKDTAPVFLPPRLGYAIAIETLKNTSTALVGYGPESFVEAYNKTRPATINLTPLWNIRFTNSSNELFTIITTLGLLGLAAWVWLTITLLKNVRQPKRDASAMQGALVKLVTLSLLFLFILLPATYIHYFVLFIFLTLWALYIKFHQPSQVRAVDLSLKGISLVRPGGSEGQAKESQLVILPFLVALPFIGLTLFVWWYFFRLYNAEVTFKRSLDAAARNEGVPTYDLQRSAITQNPYFSRYRRAYAATNLALANSLAGKENLTDEDRQNITQLIQQAIREGKAAVAIDTQNAANWENLAGIYRALIGVAQNADAWTLASLAQAIQTDPVNPRLRLDLGGVYYAIGQYDQSIRLYQQATELKPDWANAYYNLAASYRQKEDNNQAYEYLKRTLELVQPDSADYAKAQEELATLADELNKTEETPAPPQTELNAPSIAPTQPPENQVELPDNAGPQNIQNISPAPNETPVETPAPTSTP